ncbi:Hypothetical predicted protein [Xyrichtys novacula]|uniref:Uncharacterized protein n=1 Tax=Xyrichtys novacula TaxID=13765 RepID=A0AAV1GRH8_XYRNO|nr:Hypothetical predicted protein [Xyrichtys novacula]
MNESAPLPATRIDPLIRKWLHLSALKLHHTNTCLERGRGGEEGGGRREKREKRKERRRPGRSWDEEQESWVRRREEQAEWARDLQVTVQRRVVGSVRFLWQRVNE